MVLKEAHKRVSFRGGSGTLGGVITEAEFTPSCDDDSSEAKKHM
jgi:hypothetical protein